MKPGKAGIFLNDFVTLMSAVVGAKTGRVGNVKADSANVSDSFTKMLNNQMKKMGIETKASYKPVAGQEYSGNQAGKLQESITANVIIQKSGENLIDKEVDSVVIFSGNASQDDLKSLLTQILGVEDTELFFHYLETFDIDIDQSEDLAQTITDLIERLKLKAEGKNEIPEIFLPKLPNKSEKDDEIAMSVAALMVAASGLPVNLEAQNNESESDGWIQIDGYQFVSEYEQKELPNIEVDTEHTDKDSFSAELSTQETEKQTEVRQPFKMETQEQSDANTGIMPEAKPDVTVEAKSNVTVEAKPDAMVEAKSNVTVEAKPDATVEAKPEVMVEAKPEVTVEEKSEVTVEMEPEIKAEIDDLIVRINTKLAVVVQGGGIEKVVEESRFRSIAVNTVENTDETQNVENNKPVFTEQANTIVHEESAAQTDDGSQLGEDKGREAKTNETITPVNHTQSFERVRAEIDIKSETPQVNTKSVIDQIVQSAKLYQSESSSRLELQLYPKNLGKISIVLTSNEQGVTAQLKTGNDEVRNMLSQHIGELQNALKDMGINMKNIQISRPDVSPNFSHSEPKKQNGESGAEKENTEKLQKLGTIARIRQQASTVAIGNRIYGATSSGDIISDTNTSVEFRA